MTYALFRPLRSTRLLVRVAFATLSLNSMGTAFGQGLAAGTTTQCSQQSQEMEGNPMKNFVLAAFSALSLMVAIAPVASAHSTIADDVQATRAQQTGSYGSGG